MNAGKIPRSSMFFWWPLIRDLDIPKPKTVMIEWKVEESPFEILDGKTTVAMSEFIAEIKAAADGLGYPFFLRSDEVSNKHEWGRSCYVESGDRIAQNLSSILELTAMEFGIGFRGVAVREFLDLDSRFTSHNGMPVAAERRYFVKDGIIECFHPYWPPAAISRPSVRDWKERLEELQTQSAGEFALLKRHAEKVCRAAGGHWSIDFCRHRNGTWYLTDMAPGELSYHWATCPNAPKEMMEIYGDPEVQI